MRNVAVLALTLAVSLSAHAQTALERARQQYGNEQAQKAKVADARSGWNAYASKPIASIDTAVGAALRLRPLPEKVSLAYMLGVSNDVNAPWDETANARAVEFTRRVAPGCLSAMDDLVMAWYRLSEEISSSSDRATYSRALVAACDRSPQPYADWEGGPMGRWYGYFLDRVKQRSWRYYDLSADMRRRGLDTGPSSAADGTTMPVALNMRAPMVPPALARKGFKACRVTLRLAVTATGKVSDASIMESSCVAELDKSALTTAKTWTYRAGLDASGYPMPVDLKVPIDFSPMQ